MEAHHGGLSGRQVIRLLEKIGVQMDLVCRDQVDYLVGQIVDGGQLDVELGLGRLVGHEHHKVLGVVEDAEYAGTDEEQEPHALVECVQQNENEQEELAEAANEHG